MAIRDDLKQFLDEWAAPTASIIVKTSGSTGTPKLITVEKSKMLHSARNTCDFLGLRNGQISLLCMPLAYIAGKMMVVRSIVRGMKLISVEPSNHPLAQLVDVPDFAAMVPSQVVESLKVEAERNKLRNIGCLLIGGGAIDDKLAFELKDFPNPIWSTYGMTETLSHIALRRINGKNASLTYKTFKDVRIALSSKHCLMIDAPWAIEASIETTDIAELVSDTEFIIKGRIDNVICSGGIKIQIEDVEQLLKKVIDKPFLITSQKDEKFGEVVVLLYSSTIDKKMLHEICRNALPKYWIPKHYYHVDKLPLTDTQKPSRKRAKEIVSLLVRNQLTI